MTLLEDYLAEAMKKPWKWGEMDCCFFAGNWIREATGFDPMSTYRQKYSTSRAALELIKERGGLVEMVGREMTRCGFSRTEYPDHGDIGVITIMDACSSEHKVAGASVAIRSGPWWIAKGLTGASAIQVKAEAVWRVG